MGSGGAAGSARRIAAVARMTFREALRRRIVLAALVMSAAFLALYGLGLHFAAKDLLSRGGTGMDELLRRGAAAQLLYIGLFPASFIVGLTAVFASVGTISSELDSGVIYGVLARPIRRGELVVGKFLGLGLMLAAYAAVLDGAIVGLARWQISAPVTDWPGALALFVLEPLVLVAIALLASSRLPTLAGGVLCTAAYAIGFVGGFIEQIGGIIKNQTMIDLGIVSSLLMPLDAVHRKAVSLVLPNGLLFGGGAAGVGIGENTTPSVWMIVYAVGFVAVAVWLAARTFSRRDL
jgi:Cu-processing system permease protein